MRKRKSGQPAGTDLDWFVIPIQKIRQWALIVVLLVVAAGVGYFVLVRGKGSPQERARSEIAQADSLLARATRATGAGHSPPRATRRRFASRSSRSPIRGARSGARARGSRATRPSSSSRATC